MTISRYFSELLETSAPEVAGRASTTVSRKLGKKLAKLAAGRCNDGGRRELINLLQQQPDLIPKGNKILEKTL